MSGTMIVNIEIQKLGHLFPKKDRIDAPIISIVLFEDSPQKFRKK